MKGAKSKTDGRLAAKRKGADNASKPAKRGKAGKDPNKPKRPASAFFVFMEGFRLEFKEKNPNNKSIAAVSKAGGEKWKAMSDSEKAPYAAKADKRKTEYTKDMASYNKKQSGAGGKAAAAVEEDESDKSKSEVHDDDDESEEGSGEDDEDDE